MSQNLKIKFSDAYAVIVAKLNCSYRKQSIFERYRVHTFSWGVDFNLHTGGKYTKEKFNVTTTSTATYLFLTE